MNPSGTSFGYLLFASSLSPDGLARPDFSSAWYYTLSTVSQSFASAYAIIFAIALHRLGVLSRSVEEIDARVNEFFRRIKANASYQNELAELSAVGKWREYHSTTLRLLSSDRVSNRISSEDEAYDRSEKYVGDLCRRIAENLDAIGLLKKQLVNSMVATGVMVFACTLFLPAGAWVSLQMLIVMWVCVAGISGCLLLQYFWLLLNLMPFDN